MFIIVFRLGNDRPSGFFFRACFTSFHTHASLLTFFVCLSYFILAVCIRECLGKHSRMSSPFTIAIHEWYLLFSDSATTSAQCVLGAKN